MDDSTTPNFKNINPDKESKTIRPVGDKIVEATIRVNTGLTKELSLGDKTMRPLVANKNCIQKATDATMRPGQDKTLRQEQQQAEIESIIQSNETEFYLKGKLYTVVEVISQQTGEAQIYLVEREGNKFVLKLYFLNIQPPPNMQIIEKIKDIAETELLINIYDCGTWINPKTSEVRQYELMEYCSGGSLENIKLNGNEELLGEIALQCAAAINFLNSKGIIHRDIKPANFFYKTGNRETEELRLADFGISVPTNNEGKAIIKYQLRTKIYAAPEYYLSIDQEIQIDYNSDFYSLGMMLLVLWNGEEIFKIKELELVRLKIDGKLPYPENVSNRTLQLLKALTVVNPKARAGYNEIVRWAKGEEIYDLRKESNEGFNIIFDSADNQIATSPEELGQFMYSKQELATKYLYSGKIAEWLTANKRPELAIEMEDIVENKCPKNKEAGFFAACYTLDKSIPYEDLNNNQLDNPESIAKSLRENFDYYSKALANKKDKLFMFFNSHGLRNITQKFASIFSKNSDNSEALLQLIYTLNPNSPWILVTEAGNEIECNTLDNIISVVNDNILEDESWYGLTEESFLLWVRNIDPIVEGKIRSLPDHYNNPWVVVYNLNPKVSYNLTLDENDEEGYYFTATQVADYMDTQMILFLNAKEKSIKDGAGSELDMLCYIDNSRLYYYLKSKGVYDEKIDWIKYCVDLKSKENLNKYAPYNWKTGLYKSIKGLGADPCYYFPNSDKYIYTLDELDEVPVDEIRKELKEGFLKEWIAVSFQENPAADLSQQYSFERLTVDYLEFISRYNVNDQETSAYFNATNQVQNTSDKLNRNFKFHLAIKVILGALTTIVVGVVIYYLLNMNLTFISNSSVLYIVPLIIAYFSAKYIWGECLQSFIKSFLIGLGIFIGLSLIISLTISYPTYIFAGLLLTLLSYMAIVCYIKPKLSIKDNRDLMNPGFEELHLEPLHFAFIADANSEFCSSFGDRSMNFINLLKANTKRVIQVSILVVLLSVATGYTARSLFKYKGDKQHEIERYEQIKGEYKGIFDNKNALFNVVEAVPGRVDATIKVKYKNLINESLKGTINIDSRTFHFDDLNINNKLDGEYNGSFNEDFSEFSGIYRNYKTKKQVEFKFNK